MPMCAGAESSRAFDCGSVVCGYECARALPAEIARVRIVAPRMAASRRPRCPRAKAGWLQNTGTLPFVNKTETRIFDRRLRQAAEVDSVGSPETRAAEPCATRRGAQTSRSAARPQVWGRSD